MEMLWFWLVSVMVAIYVVMDGFDFGAGILHLVVAKTNEERREVLSAIGPWSGQGESDCLIKTKHCDGRKAMLTQCDFCPVL